MTRMIGYASPPEHSQWKKGQSGNPSGRKKGQSNFKTDLAAELAELVKVTDGGKPRRFTKQQLLIKGMLNLAIKGDVRAAQVVTAWRTKHLPDQQAEPEAPLTEAEEAAIEELFEREIRYRSSKPQDEVP